MSGRSATSRMKRPTAPDAAIVPIVSESKNLMAMPRTVACEGAGVGCCEGSLVVKSTTAQPVTVARYTLSASEPLTAGMLRAFSTKDDVSVSRFWLSRDATVAWGVVGFTPPSSEADVSICVCVASTKVDSTAWSPLPSFLCRCCCLWERAARGSCCSASARLPLLVVIIAAAEVEAAAAAANHVSLLRTAGADWSRVVMGPMLSSGRKSVLAKAWRKASCSSGCATTSAPRTFSSVALTARCALSGSGVGAGVSLGCIVGDSVGDAEGEAVGLGVGLLRPYVGASVGEAVGEAEGEAVGKGVKSHGRYDGAAVGCFVGCVLGCLVGRGVGDE